MSRNTPETLASRVDRLIKESGQSQRAIANKAGLPESTIRNIIGGTVRSPRGVTLRRLANALGVDPSTLEEQAPDGGATAAVYPFPVSATFSLPRDMPVLGTAAASELSKGAFQLTSDVVEYVRRPPGLLTVEDAYALYVEGDSMAPRFEDGDLVFVHPHRKCRPGDYIIVQEPDDAAGEKRAYIKRLIRTTTRTLQVQQFNPPAQIDFLIRSGLEWHKVVTDIDLYNF